MQLWKSLADLLVSKKLTLGTHAQVVAFNSSGVAVPVALGAAEARSAIIKGSVSSADLANASAAASTTGGTTISLTTTAYVGDWIEVVSNGVNWLLSGSVKAQGGLTIA